MKKIILSSSFVLPTLVLPTFVLSCGETNRFFLAQKYLKDFLKNIQENKIDLKAYQNKEAVSEIKYLKYLLNASNEKNKYAINYFKNKLELKVFVPFLQSNNSSDITKTSLGRMIRIAHGNHFHVRFVTWDEFPPTQEEREQFEKKGYVYTFENVGLNGFINWDKIKLTNDFLRSDNFPKLIDLSKNKQKTNSEFKKGVGIAQYQVSNAFIEQFKKAFPFLESEIQKITNKDYKDRSEENNSWQYNAEHENLLLSDAAMNLGVDLINIFSKSKKENFGFDGMNFKPALLNYWLVNKPNSHKFTHQQGISQKQEVIDGLLGLNENQLAKLNEIDKGHTEFQRFISSLSEKQAKSFQANIKKFRSIVPETGNQNVKMKLFYFKQNNQKIYVDNIFVLVRALYKNFIKLKNQDQKEQIYYYTLAKDAREISQNPNLIEKQNSNLVKQNLNEISLNFSINLERAFDWSKKEPLYYLSKNEKIYQKENYLQIVLNN